MKIVLGVAGSIAAYRSPDLVKEFRSRGHEVRVVLTRSAAELVSKRVLSTFSGHPVLGADPFAPELLGTDHIALARWAEAVVIYGATAHFLARYAQGLADDLLLLQLLALEPKVPVHLAPAMNPEMWKHPAVVANTSLLRERGVSFIGPIHGTVACEESGVGHVADTDEIAGVVESGEKASELFLEGHRLLISLGAMTSELDPARSLRNRSSGRMGLELGRAARRAGARVRLLLGETDGRFERALASFSSQRFTSPESYAAALEKDFSHCDTFISVAAVLDFALKKQTTKMARQKLPAQGSLSLDFEALPDFVAGCARHKRSTQKVIAFAAEAEASLEKMLERAQEKMKAKGVDAIVANPLSQAGAPDNELWVLRPGARPLHLGPSPKAALSRPLLQALLSQNVV